MTLPRKISIPMAGWSFFTLLLLLCFLFMPVWPHFVAGGAYSGTGLGLAVLFFLIALMVGAFVVAADDRA